MLGCWVGGLGGLGWVGWLGVGWLGGLGGLVGWCWLVGWVGLVGGKGCISSDKSGWWQGMYVFPVTVVPDKSRESSRQQIFVDVLRVLRFDWSLREMPPSLAEYTN